MVFTPIVVYSFFFPLYLFIYAFLEFFYFVLGYSWLEKAMAPHSRTLAWKIPWMEEPDRLQSMGLLSQTRLSNFPFTFHFHALETEMATHSSVLAWSIPGMGEPGGLPSMGSHRVRHDWSDLAAAAALRTKWSRAKTHRVLPRECTGHSKHPHPTT